MPSQDTIFVKNVSKFNKIHVAMDSLFSLNFGVLNIAPNFMPF
jgi:hypothetical protein